jgi:hypothetical protein
MTFNFLLVLFNDRRGKVVFHVVHKVFLNGLVQWFLITEYGTDIVAFVANNFRSATFLAACSINRDDCVFISI